MAAKSNTAPTALGGTNNSLDEPASNRAGQDFAMPRIPRQSRETCPGPRPGSGNPEPPTQASEKLSEMTRTPGTRTREILFVDPGVSDIETILGHLRPEVEATLLDPVRPAARQMADAAVPAEISLSAPWGGESLPRTRSGGRGEVGAAPGPQQPPQAVSYAAAAATPAREIAFIDPAVDGIATLLGHLRPEVEAILLDPVRPVAHQMAAALAGERDLAAIHIIAHGAPGRVDLTADQWSADTLADDAEDLAAIGRALATSGDLRLWSCRTAAGPAGAAFVAGLTQASGADTAAATGLVGAAALGGNWECARWARWVAPQPPLTGRGLQVYAGLLPGAHRIISGDVPHDPAENVTYVVVNSRDKRVVATFSLPGHANIPKFSITVTVPSGTEIYEAGRLDERGNFIPANFTVSETSPFSTGPMNAGEPRHGA
jgi:hypothetical protein